MMKKFRGKEVIGWQTITANSPESFDKKINSLMNEYDFIDCQYSSCFKYGEVEYSAIVLLGAKE